MIKNYDVSKKMDYENGFYLTSDISRIGNIISHYELYKKIVGLPGQIVELGVFKGGSLIQFATFREILENEQSRKIIGFDVFGEFPQTDDKLDENFREKWVKETDNDYLERDDLYESLIIKGIRNVELIKGNILETLPRYVEEHPFFKIALLHIDTDIYAPAKLALECLFDKVVRGGVIVFDDYGIAGETKAVDEFINDTDYILQKYNFSHHKPSYIVKK